VKYNLAEKLGVLKAIDQVIRADDRIYEGEAIFISQLSNILHFDADLFMKAREIELDEAMAILKVMPENKKEALARMLNEAANADGRVGEDELKAIYRIFSLIGISFDDL
jgi:uncharacterized tellurite resistance protein B-like protein